MEGKLQLNTLLVAERTRIYFNLILLIKNF